jgi:hypothetical protein
MMMDALSQRPLLHWIAWIVAISIFQRWYNNDSCLAYTALPQPHNNNGIVDTEISGTVTTTTSTAIATAAAATLESTSDTSKSSTPFSLLSFPSILPPPSDIDKMNQIVESIQDEFQREINDGFQTFGASLNTDNTGNLPSTESSILDVSFEQEHFHTRALSTTHLKFRSFSVEVGNAGPDETFHDIITGGNFIHQTQQPIVSDQECDALIQEAKDVLSNASIDTLSQQQATESKTTITNYELGEVRVSQLLHTRQWLQQVLHTRFFPMIASRFGIPVDDITLQDGLIIGYGYQSEYGSKAQPIHRDSCLVSINIALSSLDDYTNGGTYFEGLWNESTDNTTSRLPYRGGTIRTQRGHALCHLGGIAHAGRSIGPNGERWVLVLFCIARNIPEYARRCHAHGMSVSAKQLQKQPHEQQQLNIEEAKLIFQTGLSFAPDDHLLLTSLGRTYIDQDEKDEIVARNCLALAAQKYDYCMKANLALGRMMLANRRPRAALRRFDRVLDWLQDRDINVDDERYNDVWEPYRSMGYDARYFGAQAALISAREAKKRSDSHSNDHPCTFEWRKHVQIAVERCHIVLRSTPDDSRVHGMLSFADNLLLS